MSSGTYNQGNDFKEELAQARADIEGAIATLEANKRHITEGQEKAIKRIIYGAPEAQNPQAKPRG